MTPRDVAEFRGINQFPDGVAQDREHPLEPGMKEQRFFVAHEEVIELHVEVGNVNRKPEQVRGDFINLRSAHTPFLASRRYDALGRLAHVYSRLTKPVAGGAENLMGARAPGVRWWTPTSTALSAPTRSGQGTPFVP